jgi:hypothetical protein
MNDEATGQPPTESTEELIRPSDFDSLRVEIVVTSLVSGVSYEAEQGAGLLGFPGDRSLLISAPARAFKVGAVVTLDVFWASSAQAPLRKVLAATAEVREIQPVEDDPSMVACTLWLLQFDAKELETLVRRFSARQEAIERFLETNRG